MSNTTIHYINVNHRQFDDSLVRQSDLDDDRFVYSQCPVFNHKSSRVFVATSPINFKMQVLLDNLPESSEKDIRDKAILELMYSSGLRVSEVSNLTSNSINKNNSIRV